MPTDRAQLAHSVAADCHLDIVLAAFVLNTGVRSRDVQINIGRRDGQPPKSVGAGVRVGVSFMLRIEFEWVRNKRGPTLGRTSMRFAIVISMTCLLAAPVLGTPTVLTVNSAQSNVSVQLCMTVTNRQCDTDASPVVGNMVVDLDCLTNPTMLTLHDFDFALSNALNLNLNWGTFVGRFDAVASNLAFHYDTPGTPQLPTPITATAFSYAGVPANATGSMSYNATILVCVGMTGAGLPCNDSIDLSTLALAPVGFNGTVTVTGRTVATILAINSSSPIDPNNPTLGTLTVTGTIRATGVVPLPSVANFVGVLMGTVTQPDLVCESDMNADGAVNGLDVQPYVRTLVGP